MIVERGLQYVPPFCTSPSRMAFFFSPALLLLFFFITKAVVYFNGVYTHKDMTMTLFSVVGHRATAVSRTPTLVLVGRRMESE